MPGPLPSFDFTALASDIAIACRRAFADVARAHPDESPCAFALYSDEDAVTVCPAFELPSYRAKRLAARPEDVDVNTFSTAEWALEGFGAREEFRELCTRVRTHVSAIWQDEDAHASFRAQLYQTCIEVLERLRDEGMFRPYPGLLLMFAVSDNGDLVAEHELRVLERLNGSSSPYVAQYRRWVATWLP